MKPKNTPLRRFKTSLPLASVIAAMLSIQQTQAGTTLHWDPANSTNGTSSSGGTDAWSSGTTFWEVTPGDSTNYGYPFALNGRDAVFGGAIGGTVTIDNGFLPIVDAMTFNATGNASTYVITGTGTGAVSLNAASVPITANVNAEISSVIGQQSAGRGIDKLGVGTLTLSGTNTYTGTTTISAGVLQLGNAGTTGALTGTSSITNNANLTVNRSNDFAQGSDLNNNVISGSGSFTQAGSGTTTLSAANDYTGATAVNSGKLVVTATGTLGNNSATTVNTTGTLVVVAANASTRNLANSLVLDGGTVLGVQENVGTGGTVAVGSNVTHTFTSSGTLTLPGTVTASALIVGGGGGGGGGVTNVRYDYGGGGGQVLNLTGLTLSSGAVTVGAGGTGASTVSGTAGGTSSVDGNTAAGGGGAVLGSNRGGTSGSGNLGGTFSGSTAGGGGGNSAVGSNAAGGNVGGAGGAGSANTAIIGLTGTYGGGGGGGGFGAFGLGGVGGGGGGGYVAGQANTGGGGGPASNGGSGLVVVQYAYVQSAGTVNLSGGIDLRSASTLDAYGTGGLLIVGGVMQTTTGTGGITIASSNNAGGVVRYDAANTYLGDTTINGGTLQLGANDVIPNSSNVSIGTATLDAATSGTETAATLDVTAAATINLASGANLVFTGGGTGTWAGSLNITGTFVSGTSLNFGSSSGLTPTQLGQITVNNGGGPFTLDGSGFLMSGGVSGYAAWQSANGTAQAANLDHDNDGVSNGVEHFLGGIANTTGNSNPLPGVTNTAGVLSVTWTRHPNYPGFPANYGTAVIVETSATLTDPWTPAVVGVGAGFVEITGNNVKYTFPAGSKNFARLKVVQTP